jgi:DNA-binding MarR family transcriptional regulator
LNGGAQLDEVVHQRNRLAILAVLEEASKAEFGFLQTTLDLTPGNLSRHLEILESAGYVAIEKGYSGKRPRTWVRITKSGRAALRAEVAALRSLLRRVDDLPQTRDRARSEG